MSKRMPSFIENRIFSSSEKGVIKENLRKWTSNPSPDRSENPFVAGFATKDCSG
ncbi:hypothetical protein [Flavobacterium sp. TAB 87]|uniref:hypothetical protein n=1 Tax=Flavobacterium sp. TAB 87 TaxID=1729581 RepID=UPI0012FBD459|nr:hypothetical protein [Flavobacterium sp. TAB 87]